MDILLNEIDARVLGALIEKEITTPDYYPLSLNALVNACNQKNNREPVMTLVEDQVRDALRSLGEQRLAGPTSGADSRVTKYEHRVYDLLKVDRREIAVLCVLLLRGPQTPGELRGRTERMYQFPELADVQSTLQKMMQREPALVAMLARQPGTKEARYAHLLSGAVEAWESPETSATPTGANNDKIARLESEVASLRDEVENLRSQFAEFRKQFE